MSDLLRDNAKVALIALLVLTAAGCISDLISPDRPVTILWTIVSLYCQCEVTRRLLIDLGLLPEDHKARRVGAVFGLGILSGLATLIGCLFLLIPGVILAVRWFASVPALISEDIGVTEAMSRSWQETAGLFWPILVVLATVYAPVILVIVVAVIAEPQSGFGLLDFIMNLVIAASSVVAWHAAVAVYAKHRGAPHLAEVFA